jgi:arylsulfatase A-like enzyme
LGLGNAVEKNWNKELKPGPNEVGFDYSFIFPATADRVPTVFLENHSVIGLDSTDPIEVSYERPVGNDPLGKDNPQLLKMQSDPDHEHDKTIVNGIARIGYMRGGKRARWTDEEMPLTFLQKAKDFIEDNRRRPFFLYYSLTEPHVPRMPSTMFKNKSGLGYRGDVILQLDWAVGEIMKELEQLGIEKNTIIVFSSDNGPVLDDGYQDEAITRLNGHTPGGPLRGGKYSAFEAGTRVPLILRWPSVVQAKVSDALLSQIDFLASFAHLLQTSFPATEAADSYNMLDAFLGKTSKGRDWLIEQNAKNTLSIIKDNWKFIEPNPGTSFFSSKRIELGNNSAPQLYHLTRDIREQNNLAEQGREKVDELKVLLQKIKSGSTKEL